MLLKKIDYIMKNEQKTFEENNFPGNNVFEKQTIASRWNFMSLQLSMAQNKASMKIRCIDFIDATVCKNYLLQEFDIRDYWRLSKQEKTLSKLSDDISTFKLCKAICVILYVKVLKINKEQIRSLHNYLLCITQIMEGFP